MLEIEVGHAFIYGFSEAASLIFEPKPERMREQTFQIFQGEAFQM